MTRPSASFSTLAPRAASARTLLRSDRRPSPGDPPRDHERVTEVGANVSSFLKWAQILMSSNATFRAGNGAEDASDPDYALAVTRVGLDGECHEVAMSPEASLETAWRAKLSFDHRLECVDERAKSPAMMSVLYTPRRSEAKPR